MAVGLFFGRNKVQNVNSGNYVSCYDLDYANSFINQICGTSDVTYITQDEQQIKTKEYSTTEANNLLNQILGTTDVVYY